MAAFSGCEHFSSGERTGIQLACLMRPTCVRLAPAVGPGRRRPVPGLHLQGERALGLPVEDLLGEHLARLGIDLKAVLALIPYAVHDVVVDLVVWEGAVLINGIYPGEGWECVGVRPGLMGTPAVLGKWYLVTMTS